VRANALANCIERIAESAPMHIDGELVTPLGRAVHWTEWNSETSMLLAKNTDGVQLIARDEVFR